MTIFSLVWLGGIALVMFIIVTVIFGQVADDFQTHNPNQLAVETNNPFAKRNIPEKRENTIYVAISRYLSLLSVVFALLIFGLLYVFYLEDFYTHASTIRQHLGYATAPFFFSITAAAALTTKVFMRQVIVENRRIRVARANSAVVAALAFIFYLLLFSFFHEIRDTKYNLIKGITMSFSIGVLFYIIFGQTLHFPFLNWIKRKKTEEKEEVNSNSNNKFNL